MSPRRGWRMWRARINFLTLANRSAGGCCGQWQTSSTRTQRSPKMHTLIRPRAIIILARVGPGAPTSRPAPALQSTLTRVCPSPGALCQGRVGHRPFGRLGVGDSPSLRSDHVLRHGRTQRPLPAPYFWGRVVPNHPRRLRGRYRSRVSEFAPMCGLRHGTKYLVATLRLLEHPTLTCIPRRHALGARRGLPGAAGALSCDRRTVHLPTVPPGGKFCP